jgi:ribosome-associated toxin RatA of RatAB toxin-antitoxin module
MLKAVHPLPHGSAWNWDTWSVSAVRKQALINAAPEDVWELVGNPRRHPEWWPRVIEVRGERFDEGDSYAQVTRAVRKPVETTFKIEQFDEDLREVRLRCMKTGTYAHWLLTEARGDTFVDVEFGMDPATFSDRFIDMAIGKLFFRRWLEESIDALERAAGEPSAPTSSG